MTPVASPDACAPEHDFIDSGISYMLEELDLDSHSEIAKSLVTQFKGIVLPVRFHATVHREASLMGLIVACKNDKTPLPKGMKRKQLEPFKVVRIYICVP